MKEIFGGEGMIKLRPHHLLCIKAYEGMGYSKEFTKNMNKIVSLLREREDSEVEVVLGLDSICSCCPSNSGAQCTTEEKVCEMDFKVCEQFNLDTGIYKYRKLNEKINSKVTWKVMNYICGKCSWYQSGRCAEIICNLRK